MLQKEAFGLALALLLLFAPTLVFAGDTATVEQAVRAFFADTPVMINIASCESEFHQFNDDGSVLHGGYKHTMVGIFQIAPLHIPTATAHGFDIDTVSGNMGYARFLYQNSGTAPWLDSSPCWAKMSVDTAPIVRAGTMQSSNTAAVAEANDNNNARIAALQQQIAHLTAILNALIAARSTS